MDILVIGYFMLIALSIGGIGLFMYDYLMGKITGPQASLFTLIALAVILMVALQWSVHTS